MSDFSPSTAPSARAPLTSASEQREWEQWLAGWYAALQMPIRLSWAARTQAGEDSSLQSDRDKPSAPPPTILIFAPHPDDECIVGALPLRLRREAGWRVINVAVTLGSRTERRAERWSELSAACALLDFELVLPAPNGFDQIKPEAATAQTPLWTEQVAATAELLRAHRPALVLVPHESDGIPTHIGVHLLVTEALRAARLNTVVARTEFWATQPDPNALIETGLADTVALVRALACHHGEIARNPYHFRLPAWMADNVRRGGELLAGPGETPPAFGFGTLYRLTRWTDGEPVADLPPVACDCDEAIDPAQLFGA